MIPQNDGTDLTVDDIPTHVNGFVCEPTNDTDGLDGAYVPYSCR